MTDVPADDAPVFTEMDEELSDATRRRIERLVEAESQVVALTAQVEHLTGQLKESEYDRDQAEYVAGQVRSLYPRRVYVPGDDPPERAADAPPTVLVSLDDGRMFRASQWDDSWVSLDLRHTVYDWRDVLGEGPLIECSGRGATRMWEVVEADRSALDALRSAMWEFERDTLYRARLNLWDVDYDRNSHEPLVMQLKTLFRTVSAIVYCAERKIAEADSARS